MDIDKRDNMTIDKIIGFKEGDTLIRKHTIKLPEQVAILKQQLGYGTYVNEGEFIEVYLHVPVQEGKYKLYRGV